MSSATKSEQLIEKIEKLELEKKFLELQLEIEKLKKDLEAEKARTAQPYYWPSLRPLLPEPFKPFWEIEPYRPYYYGTSGTSDVTKWTTTSGTLSIGDDLSIKNITNN